MVNCSRSLFEEYNGGRGRAHFSPDDNGNGVNCEGLNLEGIDLGGSIHEISEERLAALDSGEEWAEELSKNGIEYFYDIDVNEDNYVSFARLDNINLKGANLKNSNAFVVSPAFL